MKNLLILNESILKSMNNERVYIKKSIKIQRMDIDIYIIFKEWIFRNPLIFIENIL